MSTFWVLLKYIKDLLSAGQQFGPEKKLQHVQAKKCMKHTCTRSRSLKKLLQILTTTNRGKGVLKKTQLLVYTQVKKKGRKGEKDEESIKVYDFHLSVSKYHQ